MGLCLSPAAKASDEKLRLICVSSLEEDQEVILASHDADGKWQEHVTVKLRSSLITDLLPAQTGELHLAVRRNGNLESICQFTYSEDANVGLVAVIANPKTNTYDAHFVDPEKAKFEMGTQLIFNLSERSASVFLGAVEQKIEAGQQALVKPPLEDNGMFRMQISYPDANGGIQACYDRYVSGNPDSRVMLFLLPDESTGIRAMRIPLLGDLD